MPVKLSTTVNNINTILNKENQLLVKELYEYMKSSGTSDKYQNNNLKTIIAFGKFLGSYIPFYSINKRYYVIQITTYRTDCLFYEDIIRILSNSKLINKKG